ncbi:MAG: cytochrome c biogenesis protein CcdA [Planctomycetaceae bacterium]
MFDRFGGLGLSTSEEGPREADPQTTATLLQAGETVTLRVRVVIPPGGNIYSQDPSFSKPTAISADSAVGLSPIDDEFTPDHPPKRAFDDNFQKEVEKFTGEVVFERQYRLLDGADPTTVAVDGMISFLYCKGSCRPMSKKFSARLAMADASTGAAEVMDVAVPRATGLFDDADLAPPPVEELGAPGGAELSPPDVVDVGGGSVSRSGGSGGDSGLGYEFVPQYGGKAHADGDPAVLRFQLDTNAAQGKAVLAVTLRLLPDYHVRALTPAEGQEFDPTILEVVGLRGLEPTTAEFLPNHAYELSEVDLGGGEVMRSHDHHNEVTWVRAYDISDASEVGLTGTITYQVCKGESFCLKPMTVSFTLGSLFDAQAVGAVAPLGSGIDSSLRSLALGETAPADGKGDALSAVQYEQTEEAQSLGMYLLLAFLGGMILNVMPCVLPVISIKVLSFVHQAGERPGRVFLLNAVYGLGVLAVFNALALLALFLKVGWGGLNQSVAYQMIMVTVVFSMGLSLLGVFEIPIPGMMSSGIGGKQHGEGLLGAFLTGILATLLATPCTGPYMATTLFWSVGQPAPVMFLVWNVMGLGMASPYLAIGCFPASSTGCRVRELDGYLQAGVRFRADGDVHLAAVHHSRSQQSARHSIAHHPDGCRARCSG